MPPKTDKSIPPNAIPAPLIRSLQCSVIRMEMSMPLNFPSYTLKRPLRQIHPPKWVTSPSNVLGDSVERAGWLRRTCWVTHFVTERNNYFNIMETYIFIFRFYDIFTVSFTPASKILTGWSTLQLLFYFFTFQIIFSITKPYPHLFEYNLYHYSKSLYFIAPHRFKPSILYPNFWQIPWYSKHLIPS